MPISKSVSLSLRKKSMKSGYSYFILRKIYKHRLEEYQELKPKDTTISTYIQDMNKYLHFLWKPEEGKYRINLLGGENW